MQVHCNTRLKETTQEEQGSHRHVRPSSSTIAPVALPPLLAIIASGSSSHTPRSHTHRRIQAGFNGPVSDQEICTSQMNNLLLGIQIILSFVASTLLLHRTFFCMDFRCVHLFQFLNVCDQNTSFPNSPRY